MGLVLTRPSDMTMKAVLSQIEASDETAPLPYDPDLPNMELPIFVGGPVPGPLIAVHDLLDYSESEVMPGLYVATQRATLHRLLESDATIRLFSGYSGQVFKTVGQTDGAGATVLVETHLTDPDGDYHSLAYVTKNDGQRWWIVDVIVDGGISELKVRISEYRLILKQSGVDGLIRALNAKADALTQGT